MSRAVTPSEMEALVRRIADGDRDAEAELVETYSSGVGLMLYRRTEDQDLAEDLTQQTMQVAIERLRAGALRDAKRLSGYVRQIALNLMTAHYRRLHGEWIAYDSQLSNLPCKENDPGRTIMQWDRIRLVQRAIEKLHIARDREILRRFYVDAESKEKICNEMGFNSAHFDSVISRARTRLRQLIEEQEEVEDY